MKKWAFKQVPGAIEVWRYIDNIEECKPYYYVLDAIRKYGEKDVLPILMNSMGGYHSAPMDQIVKIVESDTKPSYNDPLLAKYFIDTDDFCCGWISPEGKTYSCNHYGHLDCAERLCTDFNLKWGYGVIKSKIKGLEDLHTYNAPDEVLLNNGWIKIDASKNHYCLWDKVTDKACAKLDELDYKWGRKIPEYEVIFRNEQK